MRKSKKIYSILVIPKEVRRDNSISNLLEQNREDFKPLYLAHGLGNYLCAGPLMYGSDISHIQDDLIYQSLLKWKTFRGAKEYCDTVLTKSMIIYNDVEFIEDCDLSKTTKEMIYEDPKFEVIEITDLIK